MELLGGDGSTSGNVFAVNSEGYFGPVCRGFDSNAATVVCRQLGLQLFALVSDTRFGPVPNRGAMTDMNCTGSESHIQNCGYYSSGYCETDEGAGVYCQRIETTTPESATTATYPAEGCPAGWVDGGHLGCFLFLPDQTRLTWLEGLEVCEAAGGWLAEPRTQEQLQFLSSLAFLEESLTGVRGWWVGLSDLGHEGGWAWQTDGEEAELRDSWDQECPDTEPNNSRDCAALVAVPTRATTALYRDLDCLESGEEMMPLAPVCQRAGQTTTNPPTTTPTLPPTTTTDPQCKLSKINCI